MNDPYRLIVVKIDTEGRPSQSTIKLLMAAIKTGLYGVVLVESVDRLSRDQQLVQFLQFTGELKTQVVAVDDKLNTALGNESEEG
jgi:DNA invertase Pin-like site-specific DNA recombinase